MSFWHSFECGRYFNGKRTVHKVLESGFYWPILNKDAHLFVKTCERCQMSRNISKRDQMPLRSIIVVEIFDVWGIDFMSPFS